MCRGASRTWIISATKRCLYYNCSWCLLQLLFSLTHKTSVNILDNPQIPILSTDFQPLYFLDLSFFFVDQFHRFLFQNTAEKLYKFSQWEQRASNTTYLRSNDKQYQGQGNHYIHIHQPTEKCKIGSYTWSKMWFDFFYS